MRKTKLITELVLFLSFAALTRSQKAPTANQTAINSHCANIVALSGAKVDCANLTNAQKSALANIPSILKLALENKGYLDTILAKLREMSKVQLQSTSGSISQNNPNSGLNIEQGTTGSNSPIINSPIIVGDFPKTISAGDMIKLTAYFLSVPQKARIEVWADQFSGATPFPDKFYQALKDGGWAMEEPGVHSFMAFSAPGKRFQGVEILVSGEPLKANESIDIRPPDPLFYIGTALKEFKIQMALDRRKDQREGIIRVTFMGGFPD